MPHATLPRPPRPTPTPGRSVENPREKAVAALGDLVIAYSVFRRLGNEGIGDIASRWEERLHEVGRYTRAARYALVEEVDAELATKPASGDNFNGVSALPRNKRWLAKKVPEISANDGLEPSSRKDAPAAPWSSAPEFYLNIGSALQAKGRRCDGGFLVDAGSAAAAKDHSSLSTPQLRYRRNLRDSLGFVPKTATCV
jgi:hypothetical protein